MRGQPVRLHYLIAARARQECHLLFLGSGSQAVGGGVLDGRHSVGVGSRAGLGAGAQPWLRLHAEGVAGGRLPSLLLCRARVVAVRRRSGELLQVSQFHVKG